MLQDGHSNGTQGHSYTQLGQQLPVAWHLQALSLADPFTSFSSLSVGCIFL